MSERKLILYIAASLDGYIAKPNDDLSFLSIVEKKGEDYGYNNFIESVDTVIVGKRTYDWVMNHVPEFSHADKTCYVITRTEKAPIGKTIFYTGNLKELVQKLKQEKGKNIFCDGGAFVVNELLKEKLIDEMIISVIPILVGNGIKLFQDSRPEQRLKLLSAKPFDTGLLQMHYQLLENL